MPRTQTRFIEWLGERFYVFKNPITRIIVHLPDEEKSINAVFWQVEALLRYCQDQNIEIREYDRRKVLQYVCGKTSTLSKMHQIVQEKTGRRFLQKKAIVAVCAYQYVMDHESFEEMLMLNASRLKSLVISKNKAI